MTAAPIDTSHFVGLPACPRLGLGLAALGRPGYINLQRDAEVGNKDSRTVEAMREQSYKVCVYVCVPVRACLRLCACACLLSWV